MAQRVIRYLLEGNGSIPLFVDAAKSGQFTKGAEMVGVSVDEELRHVPVTVTRMSRAQLLVRVEESLKDEDGEYLQDMHGEQYDDAAAEAMMEAWLEAVDQSDLA